MSQSTTAIAEADTLEPFQIVPSRDTHTRTPNGQVVWTWLAWAFVGYWILFVAGVFSDQRQLNAIGAVLILGVLGWAAMERLWVKVDGVVVASLAAAIIPLLNLAVTDGPHTSDSVIKHVSLCLVMAVSRLLYLPVACRSKARWLLALQVLTILAICVTVNRGAEWDGGTRSAGLFPNPNNLALIPFLLLFFVDEARDPFLIRLAVHAIVVAVLAFTATSGAVVAYGIGMAVHLNALLSRKWRLGAFAALVAGGLAVVTLIAVDGEKLLPENRLTKQVFVMGHELGNVINGEQVAYYKQEQVLGPGASSGVWRLVHWRRTFTMYTEGSPVQQIFGFGLGSSAILLGKLPHNEYLQALFEQGLIGLALFLFVWYRIITTAPAGVRYVGLIVAIYSFSENNIDNFPFMSLFILCLSATELAWAGKTSFQRNYLSSSS